MKTKGKAWHLIATVLLIVVFVYTAFFGVYAKYGDTTTTYIKGAKDIRFGVDIKGGVNVTFVPSDGYDATEEQLEAAQLVIENRLVALNVTDYELYVDNNSDSLILEFPWQSGETDFDPEAAIDEIGTTAYLTFREGSSADGELILDGSMIESAAAQYGPVSNGGASEYFVSLKFTDDGAKAFGDATTKLAASGGTISIWLDDENVSTATVNTAITDGSAIITSSASNPFTQEQVVKMARQINSGALPFALTVDSYSTVSPSLGEKFFFSEFSSAGTELAIGVESVFCASSLSCFVDSSFSLFGDIGTSAFSFWGELAASCSSLGEELATSCASFPSTEEEQFSKKRNSSHAFRKATGVFCSPTPIT